MAEVVLRTRLVAAGLADVVEVDSAGTSPWNIGAPASAGAIAVMANRGYATAHAARKFDPSWFADRDLILALDSDNARDLRQLAPDASSRAKVRMLGSYAARAGTGADAAAVELAQSVPDPYGGSDEEFARTLDLIEAACDGLVAALPGSVTHAPKVTE